MSSWRRRRDQRYQLLIEDQHPAPQFPSEGRLLRSCCGGRRRFALMSQRRMPLSGHREVIDSDNVLPMRLLRGFPSRRFSPLSSLRLRRWRRRLRPTMTSPLTSGNITPIRGGPCTPRIRVRRTNPGSSRSCTSGEGMATHTERWRCYGDCRSCQAGKERIHHLLQRIRSRLGGGAAGRSKHGYDDGRQHPYRHPGYRYI
jgi:ribosomal protein S27AE